MSDIALIHGYAVNLTSPLVRPGFGVTAGFSAFADDVRDGTASVFRWGIEQKVPWHALLDPARQYRFYRAELSVALSEETQRRFGAFLAHERPEAIVTHSMGARLLYAYASANGLPPFVQDVVMAQSDLPAETDLSPFPRTHNVYCPWDPTLLLSSALSGRARAGLVPVRGANVTNVLLPAWRPPNLHMSALQDSALRALVHGLVGKRTHGA